MHSRWSLRPLGFPGRVFEGVSPEVLDDLQARGTVLTLQASERILSEGEFDLSFFTLLSGSVRVFYQSPTGNQLTCKIFGAPAVFGEMECLMLRPYMESVVTLEPSIVHKLPRAQFLEVLDRAPQLTRNLLEDLARRLAVAADHERSLAFHSVETRLANILLGYVRDYSEPVAGGRRIRIPLTHDELSLALGVAKKSVTRAMKLWRERGILDKSGTHWVVLDQAALAEIGDPSMLSLSYRMK